MQAPFTDLLPELERHQTTLPLSGRTTEMQLLSNLLDTVAADLPIGARTLTISGEIGIGKTRLLSQICLEARARGFSILQASAYEAGKMFPYLPLIEALRPLLRASFREQLRRYLRLTAPSTPASLASNKDAREEIALSGSVLLTALAHLFPALPTLLQIEPAPPEILDPLQEKFRLFDAIATLLEDMANDTPVLLCIDNMQWADSASLELLLYLTIRLRSSRVALVGATRLPQRSEDETVDTVQANRAAAQALSNLIRDGVLLFLPLSPLSANAAAEYLHALLPGTLPENVVQPLLERAGGNPSFLAELVRALTFTQQLTLHQGEWQLTQEDYTQLPASIVLAVEQRLESISEPCRTLLRCAALFGRIFPVDALSHALARSESEIHILVDEAVQSGVIVKYSLSQEARGAETAPKYSEKDGYSSALQQQPLTSLQYYIFAQGIVQEKLLAEVPAGQARTLQAAIGKALETSYGYEARQHAAELAYHYKLGGETEATLYWSLLAGEDAARQQAHREAISHFRLMLKLLTTQERADTRISMPGRAELHMMIGELWSRLGELDQAINAFEQALQHLPDGHSPLLLARVSRLLADSYRIQAHYDQALTHLQVAQAALETPEGAAGQAFDALWFPGRSFSDTKSESQEQNDTSERILLHQTEALLNIFLNRPQEAQAALWQSHRLAVTIGDRNSQAFALHFSGWLLGWGQNIHKSIRLLEQAHREYLAIGDPFRTTMGDQLLGIIYQALGETERASLYTLRGLERVRRYGVQRMIGLLNWNQGMLALNQGDWQSCEMHLHQALQDASNQNDIRLRPLALLALAELDFRRGNWPEAEQRFLDAIQAAVTTEWQPGAISLYGHFLAVTGRHTAALIQLERVASLPDLPGFSGDYYLPFLAEGYLHLNMLERASIYIERIRKQSGLMYYGNAVDRILGVVAAQMGDRQIADQAFEGGLLLCQRAGNRPEEGAILYEQARTALMRNDPFTRVQSLCSRAREIFVQYSMERAVAMVDALQEGARDLDHSRVQTPAAIITTTTTVKQSPDESMLATGYKLEQQLTKREQEVLRLVAEGHTDREVAEILVISPRTANRHLSNIFVKLDVPGRAAAVAYAIRHRLV